MTLVASNEEQHRAEKAECALGPSGAFPTCLAKVAIEPHATQGDALASRARGASDTGEALHHSAFPVTDVEKEDSGIGYEVGSIKADSSLVDKQMLAQALPNRGGGMSGLTPSLRNSDTNNKGHECIDLEDTAMDGAAYAADHRVHGAANDESFCDADEIAEESAEKHYDTLQAVVKNVSEDKVQDFIGGVSASNGYSKSVPLQPSLPKPSRPANSLPLPGSAPVQSSTGVPQRQPLKSVTVSAKGTRLPAIQHDKDEGSGSTRCQLPSSAFGPNLPDASYRTLDSSRYNTQNRTQDSGPSSQALKLDLSSKDSKQCIQLGDPDVGAVMKVAFARYFQLPPGKCFDISLDDDKNIAVATVRGPCVLLCEVQSYRLWLPPQKDDVPCSCVALFPRNGSLTQHHSLAVGHKSMDVVELMQVVASCPAVELRVGCPLLEHHFAWCVRVDRYGRQLSVGSGSNLHIVQLDGAYRPTTVDAGGTVLALAFAEHGILFVGIRKKDCHGSRGSALQAWATSDARNSLPLRLWEKPLDHRLLSMCCDPSSNCYALTKPLPSLQRKAPPIQSTLLVFSATGALIAEVALVESSQGGYPIALSADREFTLLAVLTSGRRVLLFDVEMLRFDAKPA